MQDRIAEILLLVVAAVFGLFLLVAVVDWLLPEAFLLGRWADIALALVTILAILFGGLFAAVKFELFRDFEPHLTISHSINHRRVGESYVHIDVTVTLQNSSKVKVSLREGFFFLQRLMPVTDAEVEQIYSEAFDREDSQQFVWPTLEEAYRNWNENELIIEPGEAYSELLEFIVSSEVESVIIYTYFYNPGPSNVPTGWHRATAHDIVNAQTKYPED
jgi:hypothetical protein